MELQLLVILAVAFLVFGPEKMVEFAANLGRIVRKLRQEWVQIQMEMELSKLKQELRKKQEDGESKVKGYLSGETDLKPRSQKEILETTMEELFRGNAPVLEDKDKNKPKSS
ncbi:MAG TPA: hypothetical protein EYH48_00035 [Aquifex aeolicus]|uniref:Twin-arginine translocase TatA/TatE family subunit n=1 Tax=Aquifex aeolicus TaxID=63363 RepID=A0A9D1CGF4_AQUAO|nr:hypothetical protein [Aquificales bacterium]HIP98453.1 hypothetical protein [Aquifex aeolicus]HIQ25715.1 hypothetical protein [Aquifex aeolicus]